MKTVKMRISGSGIANNGLEQIKQTLEKVAALASWQDVEAFKAEVELNMAEICISALHDALLGVAKGAVTPEEVKDFFWNNDLDSAAYLGGILKVTDERNL